MAQYDCKNILLESSFEKICNSECSQTFIPLLHLEEQHAADISSIYFNCKSQE